jgi:hypothetical protein
MDIYAIRGGKIGGIKKKSQTLVIWKTSAVSQFSELSVAPPCLRRVRLTAVAVS